MILIKNIILAKIKKRYINKKIYLDEIKKTSVFLGLVLMP